MQILICVGTKRHVHIHFDMLKCQKSRDPPALFLLFSTCKITTLTQTQRNAVKTGSYY